MLQKNTNLVLGGGGVKGIAFIGAFEAAEKRGYVFNNIAGLSAGALAGSFLGAGYNSNQLLRIMEEFDFGKIDMKEIPVKVPAVARYLDYRNVRDGNPQKSLEDFLIQNYDKCEDLRGENELTDTRGKILKSAISMSKQGCMLDGDCLEEWVYNTLRKRGIITFGDMRYGVCDKVNPKGYKVRMTAVDITRWKIVVLPDDMSFYGIDPDRFGVAKAVRMSTSVPFAFKPVEVRKETGGGYRKYHFVDGGVLDGMPSWLIDDSGENTVGLRLKSESKQNIIDTPLKILKALVFFVHNTGVPKNIHKLKYVADIDTTDVSFLDFNLSDKDKIYLYRMGRYYANILLNKMESRARSDNPFNTLISRLFGKF